MDSLEDKQSQAEIRAFTHYEHDWAVKNNILAFIATLVISGIYSLIMYFVCINTGNTSIRLIIAIGISFFFITLICISSAFQRRSFLEWIFAHQTALHDKLFEIEEKINKR